MFIKNEKYLTTILKDAARDMGVGISEEYASKNKALDNPFTDDQLKFVVDLACSIAAEMVLWYNDAGLCLEEDPSFAAVVTSSIKGSDHCLSSSTHGTAPLKQEYLRLIHPPAQHDPNGDQPDHE